jgi:hypothetical protein
MSYNKITLASIFLAGTLFFTACGEVPNLDGVATSSGDFVYRNHNFGTNRDAEYRTGVKDGCKTSDGDYTKNHTLFDAESDYRVGWEHGRMHCKGAK